MLLTRTRQLEAVRAVNAEITRELDLSTLLQLITRRAVELVRAQGGEVCLWNLEAQVLVPCAWHGFGNWREQIHLRAGEGVAGTVASRREGLIVNNYRASPYVLPQFLDHSSVTAVLGEPLSYRDDLVGVIIITRDNPDQPFTHEDQSTLALFAVQAAIAIENARLHSAVLRQLLELRALHDMASALASSLTLDEQLGIFIERVRLAMGAQRVLVGLLGEPGTERFSLCMAYDASKAGPWLGDFNLSAERYPEIWEAVRTGKPVEIPDVSAEPMLASILEGLQAANVRSLLVTPLIAREKTIGVISLGYTNEDRKFSEEEIAHLQSFAAHAAVALEKARLIEAVRQHASELEERVRERTAELAAANRRLEEASRHKSEFLASMSHEIRAPLNSILGFTQLLRDQTKDVLSAKQARYLDHVHESGRHLLQVITDIVDLAKVEAGKFILQPESLSVERALGDILVIARGVANKKEQEIHADVEPELPPLVVDPVRFKQILFNLLSNAVKFTPERGTITLGARRATDDRRPETGSDAVPRPPSPVPCLEIAVSDTGVGIKPEDVPRLFQEFVQLETTQAQRHEGSGLGLALTKKLVELHGGQIWAESDGAGKGSTFTVRLPFGSSQVKGRKQ
jgi:signal transduction histidine kinase